MKLAVPGDTIESVKADYQIARALWLQYLQEQAHCRQRLECLTSAISEQEHYMGILRQVESELKEQEQANEIPPELAGLVVRAIVKSDDAGAFVDTVMGIYDKMEAQP